MGGGAEGRLQLRDEINAAERTALLSSRAYALAASAVDHDDEDGGAAEAGCARELWLRVRSTTVAATSCIAWAVSSNGLIVVNKLLLNEHGFR